MSKIFDNFVTHVFKNNPYANIDSVILKTLTEKNRAKFESGEKNPTNSNIEEWENLGKPNKKKQPLIKHEAFDEAFNHFDKAFGYPLKEIDNIIEQTKKNKKK